MNNLFDFGAIHQIPWAMDACLKQCVQNRIEWIEQNRMDQLTN